MQGEYDTAPNQDNFSLAEFKTLSSNWYWHIVSSLQSTQNILKAFHSIPLLRQHQVDFIRRGRELLMWRLYLDSERGWQYFGDAFWNTEAMSSSLPYVFYWLEWVGLRALDWQLVASALELETYLTNQGIESMMWRIQDVFSPVLYFQIDFLHLLNQRLFTFGICFCSWQVTPGRFFSPGRKGVHCQQHFVLSSAVERDCQEEDSFGTSSLSKLAVALTPSSQNVSCTAFALLFRIFRTVTHAYQ